MGCGGDDVSGGDVPSKYKDSINPEFNDEPSNLIHYSVKSTAMFYDFSLNSYVQL